MTERVTSDLTRRGFLNAAGGVAAVAAVAGWPGAGPAAENRQGDSAKSPLSIFAKHLQWLPPDQLAAYLADQGFDGIEATVRRGGQVAPERVETELPRLVEALDQRDRRIVIMTTDVNDADDPLTRRVLQTGADLGIQYYRMAYYKYDKKRPIPEQLKLFRDKAAHLAEQNKKLGITALYQNHAGAHYVGAGIWDLYLLLEGIAADQIGMAFDVRHATVEGGQSWPTLWQLMRDRVKTVYLKDFRWEKYAVTNVPFGTGQVNPAFVRQVINEMSPGTPVSLHMEYIDHRKKELQPQCMEAISKDRQTVRDLIGL